MDITKTLSSASKELLAGYRDCSKDDAYVAYPDIDRIARVLYQVRKAIFPGYFSDVSPAKPLDIWLQALLAEIHQDLSEEIKKVLLGQKDAEGATALAGDISLGLLEQLSGIQQTLYTDARAGFDGDPAARSIGEVILTYPGFFAVFVHRIAHYLFSKGVPLIPRIMSEYAHSSTGIDIHPGAKIGAYFFIDHGTGVVIGETTVIGKHVKLYQGVTLGALSTRSGQKLAGKRRHPVIEDNVTIYSGATILGGETVIGKNSTIGGNVFIVESVLQDTKVMGNLSSGRQ